MILGSTAEIYDLARFTERLTAAGRGAILVHDGDRAVATGWLVTPALVVVCDYVATDLGTTGTAGFRCSLGADEAAAVVAHAPSASTAGQRPALLRLARPLPDAQPLTLDLSAAAVGRRLVLVHHPGGERATRLSFGRVVRLDDGMIHHDADTTAGSGGAAVLAAPDLGVLAMHVGGRAKEYNFALPLPAILDGLRDSTAWAEIAEQHQLADVAVARTSAPPPPGSLPALLPSAPPPSGPPPSGPPPSGPPPSGDAPSGDALIGDALIAAAMRWSVDPAELPAGERDALRALVVDAKAPRWSLPLPQRQRLLREAGSPAVLRELRAARPEAETGGEVIDRILQGPPFDLNQVSLDTLPHWLQAVRWFDGVVPGLPSAAQVHRTMERRRVRGQLAAVAGPGFRGRTAELAELDAWFTAPQPGPMVVSGIGGVGKSALVARFAELLPAPIPLFWLDFDRVDLAPDDAISLVTALAGQAAVQLDDFRAPTIDADSWQQGVSGLGAALTEATAEPVLLVLDGFEIAQHAAQYQEIWPVLTTLLDSAPRLRLLVSGRAPVTNLQLGGRSATGLHLTGLDAAVADAWLAERGVRDAAVRARVVTASRGIPLVLKLAMRLLEAGGSVDDLPAEMVEGYLYNRILDRVVDEELRPIARDVLQLRAVHADMLAAVLHDRIPPGVEPGTLLDRLARELAIVESLDEPGGAGGDAGELRLRPEVRSAVLRLLAVADPVRVAEIDRRAAEWLAGQGSDDPADAAELVYHRLRTGDLDGAAAAWRAGCAARLVTAPDDLADPAARAWLLARLAEGTAEDRLAAWEREATDRIQLSNRRGLDRAAVRVLEEHSERSAGSPLTVHDAWVRWQGGDPDGAAQLLDRAGPGDGQIARDRALVRAGIAAALGDEATAERLLAGISAAERWADPVDALAVLAARVRLTVDLAAELELAALPAGLWTGGVPDSELIADVRRSVVPGDVLLPDLALNVAGLSTYLQLQIPDSPAELERFGADVHGLRNRLRERWGARSSTSSSVGSDQPPGRRVGELAARLGDLGERRWQLATSTLVLAGLRDQAAQILRLTGPLPLALAGSLAAFRGLPLTLGLKSTLDIDNLLGGAVFRAVADQVAGTSRPPLAEAIIISQERADPRTSGRTAMSSQATQAVLVYVLTPDPLRLLIHRALGLPDDPVNR